MEEKDVVQSLSALAQPVLPAACDDPSEVVLVLLKGNCHEALSRSRPC